MYIPTMSWEENCVMLKAEGKNPQDYQQAQFNTWMRERAALNKALKELDAIGRYSSKLVTDITEYMEQLELDQSELSARVQFPERGEPSND